MRRVPVLAALLTSTMASAAPVDARPTETAPFELVLHDPTGRPAPSEACDVRLCTSLVELITQAASTVDFALYGVRGQPAVFDAIVAAQARGVRVRGVVDRTLDGNNYYRDTDRLVAALGEGVVHDDLATDRQTAAAQRPFDPSQTRCWLPRPPGTAGPLQCVGYDLGDRCLLGAYASAEELSFEGDIMHDKFVVVDGRYVWMGSTNVSDSGTGGYNANVVGVWNSPAIASWYTTEFEQMYAGHHHETKQAFGPLVATVGDGIRVEGWFSPQDRPMTAAVRPLIQAATRRIDVAIFFLTHKAITADLIAAHRRGVAVRVIMDATAANNEYDKHELVRAAGIPLKVEHWGGKMHMKAAAIDGEVLVLGSMNWTSAGEYGNDENTLVVRSATHAAAFHAFYDGLWERIPDRWLTGAPDPESQDSSTACTDGTDNDFDHLADAEDPGCGPTPPPLPSQPPIYTVLRDSPQAHRLLVKGNVNAEGRKTYFLPSDALYDKVEIDERHGDRWFCSEVDAKDAGFRGAGRR